MADHPASFNTTMVQAMLQRRKGQTRRLAWKQIKEVAVRDEKQMAALERKGWHAIDGTDGTGTTTIARPSPWQKVQPGDRIYVREMIKARPMTFMGVTSAAVCAAYAADNAPVQEINGFDLAPWWKGGVAKRRALPAMHMPRTVSRLTLEVTQVRRQRLQDITAIDAIAEGIASTWGDWMGQAPPWAEASILGYGDASGEHIWDNRTSRQNFGLLWNALHGPGAWESDPEVVAISFIVHHCNINQLGTQ